MVVFEVIGDSMRGSRQGTLLRNAGFHTPVLMYVASSPRAELVSLDNLSDPLLSIAFLRASARACAVDIVMVGVVVGECADRLELKPLVMCAA